MRTSRTASLPWIAALLAILAAAAWRSGAALAPPPPPLPVNPPVIQSAGGDYAIEDGTFSIAGGLPETQGGGWSLVGGLGRTFTGVITPRPNATADWTLYE